MLHHIFFLCDIRKDTNTLGAAKFCRTPKLDFPLRHNVVTVTRDDGRQNCPIKESYQCM